jgi:uncharacterized protein (DUF1697 family)
MTGHNSMKMNDLKELCEKIGLNNAETYIQSGNIIFRSVDKLIESEVALKIERAILDQFGYNIPVMIRTIEEIKKIISNNPFIHRPDFDPSKMVAVFLHTNPSKDQVQKVRDVNYPPDEFTIIDREIFIYCPNGFGRSKLYTNFFEKKMGVIGTARNWKTITTIRDLAGKK